MNDWRDILRKYVTWVTGNKNYKPSPLLSLLIYPPSNTPWPAELPTSESIKDFYSICDGGIIEGFNFEHVSDLIKENDYWKINLTNYYTNGSSPIKLSHLYLAWDDGAAPLFWNSADNMMASFWFKGGDWEPYNKTFDEFMDWLFVSYESSNENDSWGETLRQIR